MPAAPGAGPPRHYGDAAAEALHARATVGLADLSASVLLRATGADRVSYLHRMVSCEVRGLAPGEGRRGLFLTAKGRVVADFDLVVLPERVEMRAAAAARPALFEGLRRFVVADDVAFEDRSGPAGLLVLVGPGADEAAARVLGGHLPEVPDGGGADAHAPCGPVTAFRGKRAGLPAWDLLADAAVLPALFDAALAAVRALGGGPLGADALDALRIEAGLPALGADFGEDTLPQEAGLDAAVSFTKGCFLGQEPVARLHNLGHTNRGVVRLRLAEGAPAPSRGDEVLAAGKPCGTVTSAALSPSFGRAVALAMLRNEHAAPGTKVAVRGAAGEFPGEVTAPPFVG